jgi:hypothetical protein
MQHELEGGEKVGLKQLKTAQDGFRMELMESTRLIDTAFEKMGD